MVGIRAANLTMWVIEAAAITGIPARRIHAYGVIGRHRPAELFVCFSCQSADGYYAIGKYDNQRPEIQYLTGEAPNYYQPSTAIRQGQANNNLLARCVGNELTLFANGELLASVQDNSAYNRRCRALPVGLSSWAMVVVEFDDFRAAAPIIERGRNGHKKLQVVIQWTAQNLVGLWHNNTLQSQTNIGNLSQRSTCFCGDGGTGRPRERVAERIGCAASFEFESRCMAQRDRQWQ